MTDTSANILHPILQDLEIDGLTLHPGLAESHRLDSNIFEPFFDWAFLQDKRFESWQKPKNKWDLWCTGKPGSGKTTFSSIVVKKLREKYNGSKDAVASLFIRSDILTETSFFVEDVLISIFHQMCHSASHVEEGAPYVTKYESYLEARELRHRDALRIRLIFQALELRIRELDHKFIVIDDFDRCAPHVDMHLEQYLERLRESGLKIMLTSRIPCLDKTPMTHCCNACPPKHDANLQVYWQCQTCPDGFFELCEGCEERGSRCGICGDGGVFEQPYSHVELELQSEQYSSHWMEQCIYWNLEGEHGKLPLPISSGRPHIPPHSQVGAILAGPGGSSILDSLRESAVSRSDGNITLALLRIDMLREPEALRKLGNVTDRLPAAIVALFDAAMQRIENQPEAQKVLGITAISVVSFFGFYDGAPLDTIQDIVAKAKRKLNLESLSHRSIEEILHATKGFLTIEPLQHRPLRCFAHDFHLYASEDYNESLMWARSQIHFENGTEMLKRSQTFQLSSNLQIGPKRRGTFQ